MTTPLDEMGQAAALLAEKRKRLEELVRALSAGLEAMKADRMPAIRDAIGEAEHAWSALRDLVAAHPEQFTKPRTLTMHGVKFGFEKGKGAIEIADTERTLKLIKAKIPALAKVLIDTKEVLVKKALAGMTAAELKSIGVGVKDATDQVVIRAGDDEIDKLVRALISAAVAKTEQAEAD